MLNLNSWSHEVEYFTFYIHGRCAVMKWEFFFGENKTLIYIYSKWWPWLTSHFSIFQAIRLMKQKNLVLSFRLVRKNLLSRWKQIVMGRTHAEWSSISNNLSVSCTGFHLYASTLSYCNLHWHGNLCPILINGSTINA